MPRRWVPRRAVGAAICALALVVSEGAAAQTVTRDPTPRLSWSVPPRYDKGWRAYDPVKGTYARSYVRPSRWTVRLNACASTGHGDAIDRYGVRITGVGFEFSREIETTTCRLGVAGLPRLGRYDVSLTVHTVRGRRASRRFPMLLRDWLIVSLGDSMASGEGSPDRRGRYKLKLRPRSRKDKIRLIRGDDFAMVERKPVRWQDKRCHRSAVAGHARVAAQLERRDPRSSVTFISLACSGAEIGTGLLESYAGQEPPPAGSSGRDHRGGRRDHRTRPPVKLPPQVSELRRLVGAGRSGLGRPIDALLLSIGINDLGFSKIVKRCATNAVPKAEGDSDCVYDTGVTRKIETRLGPAYDRLAARLRGSLAVGEVYMTDYPSAPFGDNEGGCGLLGLPNVGISPSEAGAMFSTGLRFNEEIRRATDRNGWNWVPGMTAAFTGRDYCEDDRLLVRLEESLGWQGTIHGAVHPNPAGHRQLARLLLSKVVLGRPAQPAARARLVVEAVRVGSFPRDEPFEVQVELQAPTDRDSATRRFSGPRRGEWIAVPEGALTFEIDVYDPPRPPRYPTAVTFLMRGPTGTNGAHHPASERFGEGRHETDHPTDRVEARYRIELLAPPPRFVPASHGPVRAG